MVSMVLRRTHMYLGLFLFPWMLMYALSTLAMTHRSWFATQAPYEVERTVPFEAVFSESVEPKLVAGQVLASLGLDGAHSVTRRKDGAYVINRSDLLTPRRLTYSPADHTVTVERLPLQTYSFLARFHRRRGYATGYGWDTAWAATVDVAIIGMMLWVLSGLWMWWEMTVTRRWGTVALLGGGGLFAAFLLTL